MYADDLNEAGDFENNTNDAILDDDNLGESIDIIENNDTDDHKESYASKVNRVTKRISKLTYERNIEREANEKLRAEVEETKAMLQELKAAHEERSVKESAQGANAKRSELLAQKKEALESGDYDLVIDLDEQLLDLRGSNDSARPSQNITPQQQPTQQPTQQPRYSQAELDWAAKNTWINDPKQATRYQQANSIYLDMIQNQGYDPDDQETYDVLDKRIRRNAPPPSTGGGVDRGNLTADERSSVRITPEDKARMEAFGMDPNDPKARTFWLDSKQKTRQGAN